MDESGYTWSPRFIQIIYGTRGAGCYAIKNISFSIQWQKDIALVPIIQSNHSEE